MTAAVAFLISAFSTAANVALYVDSHDPIYLAGAIFCGLLALFNLREAGRS